MLEPDLHSLHSVSSQPTYENDGQINSFVAHCATHVVGVMPGFVGCRLAAAYALHVGIARIAPMVKICFLNFVLLLISK